MHEAILEFIHRRWSIDSNFLNGNCYWFAHILTTRFPRLEIYYFPIEGHFVAGDGFHFYDWTGAVDLKTYDTAPVCFDDIKTQDSLYYSRLLRDCVF